MRADTARFVVATDWSQPRHMAAVMHAYSEIGNRGAGTSLVIAVPHEPGPDDARRVRKMLQRAPGQVQAEVFIEAFEEARAKPCAAAIVPTGSEDFLLLQVASWVARLTRLTLVGEHSDESTLLGSLLDSFEETSRKTLLSAESPSHIEPSWHGVYAGQGRFIVALKTGGRAYLPVGDRATAVNILQTGLYEPDLQGYIQHSVPRGGLVLDVGANIGLVTIALAHAVGAEGRVIAFEPVPANIQYLRWNVETNWLMDVVDIISKAVSDVNGLTTMSISDEWNALGSITKGEVELAGRHETTGQRRIDVEMIRLDSYFPLDVHIDLVKIDVEGAEHLVFKGMERLLEGGRIDRVVFECAREHFDRSLVRPENAWDDFMTKLHQYEESGWTFGVPHEDGTLSELTVAGIAARANFSSIAMEKPGLGTQCKEWPV